MIQPLILHRFVEDIMFKEYQKLTKQKLRLETIVRNLFKESDSLEGFKLVGSASTGTMRKDTPDLDYVVLFKHKLFYKDFATKLVNSILSPNKINYEDKYDYVKVSGHFEGFKYVFVPSTNPNGIIKDYVDDAFYHPDFINKHKNKDHIANVLLAKEFFKKASSEKLVNGISCELMILKFKSFDNLLKNIVSNNSLRINFSDHLDNYSDSAIIVDYPFLGKRSLTKYILPTEYTLFQEYDLKVLKNPENLIT